MTAWPIQRGDLDNCPQSRRGLLGACINGHNTLGSAKLHIGGLCNESQDAVGVGMLIDV